jgi:TnpA family transposase
MPTEFLTEEQKSKYKSFPCNLTIDEIAKYFLLDNHEKTVIYRLREEHNRLGYALQLGTVKLLGSFLDNPTEIPEDIVLYVSKQLGIDIKALAKYSTGRTIRQHTQEIKKTYGYHDFSDQPYHWRLIRWLYNQLWYTNDRTGILFELAVSMCISLKVLLPGATVLERLISKVKERVTTRLWGKLASLPERTQCKRLEYLLQITDKKNVTGLDTIRQQITHESPVGFLKAIERYNRFYLLGAHSWDISKLPAGKLRVLSRYAAVARAQAIERMPYERRLATLAAFAVIFTISSQDNIIDYMLKYFSELSNKADKNTKNERLRTLKDLDGSSRELSRACSLILDESIPDEKLREMIFSKVPKECLKSSVGKVDTLTKPVDQIVEYKEIFKYYNSVRRFLPKLLSSIRFKSNSAGKQALVAWEFLAKCENKEGKDKYAGAPVEGMSSSWKKVVFKDDDSSIKPCPYTFWAIEKMVSGIKNFDIYLENSEKYSDPRSNLIQPVEWESKKNKILSTLGWSSNVKESLAPLKEKLDTTYKNTVKNWETNPDVRVEQAGKKSRIVISNVDKLEEPRSLLLLKKRIKSLLPDTDLPGVLLEIAYLTKFTEQFTHISHGNSRIDDLPVSICAVLISKACNIGLKPLVHRGVPALEYDRLTWVDQNYFRSETLKLASEVLIEFYSKLDFPKNWGTGDVASADGVRILTPPKTIYAGSNPKYFGPGRGITSLDLLSDRRIGLNILTLTGTLRDSVGLLELVLGQNTAIKPREIMTDTAGYSDIIFGLFALLGYQFSPRIADMGSSKLWRFDSHADYSVLNDLTKNKLREELIAKYWDDMLRMAGSLKLGTINPTNLIRMLQRSGKPTMLGKATGEFGRIFKTIHHLSVMDDPDYRRRILTQLNMGESEHSLKRTLLFWKKGELYQATREGQEDQLYALSLVTNCIIIWNTIYIEAACKAMENEGIEINKEDKKRLSPFGHEHINIVGRYSFEQANEILNGRLRQLLPMDKKLFGI